MKNVEKYKNLIAEAIENIECTDDRDCQNCHFRPLCSNWCGVESFAEWLFEEYVPPTEITEEERIILSAIKHKYKWIARDDDNGLYVYKDKPSREDGFWYGGATGFNSFNHMFKFIKMDDEEPYNIGGLLRND